jgi:hypothetical protein
MVRFVRHVDRQRYPVDSEKGNLKAGEACFYNRVVLTYENTQAKPYCIARIYESNYDSKPAPFVGIRDGACSYSRQM